MSNGLTPIPDKEALTSVATGDKIVMVVDGKVVLDTAETVAAVLGNATIITDEESGNIYKTQYVARNGHLCADITLIES